MSFTFGSPSIGMPIAKSIPETDFKDIKDNTNEKDKVPDSQKNSSSDNQPTNQKQQSNQTAKVTMALPVSPAFSNSSFTAPSTFFGLPVPPSVSPEHTLVGGLDILFLSGKYSDVILNVQGRSYNAHKSILAIRSPVFSAMMEHDTKEKATGVIDIADCDPNIFYDFLHFLYTGKANKINLDNVISMYTIADKYQVTELCKFCVNYLMFRITLQNFCDILALSLQYHERELLDTVSQFFVRNSIEIASTVSWGSFVAENPVAANELFLKALKFYKKDPAPNTTPNSFGFQNSFPSLFK